MAHNHSHKHALGANERSLSIAALLTGGFMVAEIAGGIVSGSLALLADAGHMLTDFASLVLAWYGFRLTRRPADWRRTYGYGRFSVLIAFVNGFTLFAIAAWIVFVAWRRLNEPNVVLGGLMFWVALAGLGVNISAFWIMRQGDQDNLNIRAATLHVTGDLLGSLAAIVAAAVIIFTGWQPIDPILSIVVALIILRSAWRVVRESGHILLEGVPENLDTREVVADLKASISGVLDIHHVHAWSLTQDKPMITLHALIAPGTNPQEKTGAIKGHLKDKFGIDHATVEIEFEKCTKG